MSIRVRLSADAVRLYRARVSRVVGRAAEVTPYEDP